MTGDVHARPGPLRELVAAVFGAVGSREAEAGAIADNLVLANLSGHDSHGVGLVPTYVRSVQAGAIRLNGTIEIVVDAGAMVTVDAHMSFGQVIGREAMDLAIARTRQHGLAAVAIRNSHHLGRIGQWAEQCAAAGFVSTHYVNTLGIKPHVAPFGGSDARYSTNPYCAGMPGPDGDPVVLDMATSKVALGKVRVARNKGALMEPDTIIGPGGHPTRDPNALYSDPSGAILPFGEHKGFGLGLISELLGGAITGGRTWNAETSVPGVIHNNMLSIVLDPDRFGADATWRSDIESFVAWVKQSPPQPGSAGVMVAGEPERRARAARAAAIPIDATTWGEIAEVARSLAVPEPLLAAVTA